MSPKRAHYNLFWFLIKLTVTYLFTFHKHPLFQVLFFNKICIQEHPRNWYFSVKFGLIIKCAPTFYIKRVVPITTPGSFWVNWFLKVNRDLRWLKNMCDNTEIETKLKFRTQKHKSKWKILERVWRKGNPLTLLVGMQTSTATVENSVETSLKAKK